MTAPPSKPHHAMAWSVWLTVAALVLFLLVVGRELRQPQRQIELPVTPPQLSHSLPSRLPAGRPFAAEVELTGTRPWQLSCSHPEIAFRGDGVIAWPQPGAGDYRVVLGVRAPGGEISVVWQVEVYEPAPPVRMVKVKLARSPEAPQPAAEPVRKSAPVQPRPVAERQPTVPDNPEPVRDAVTTVAAVRAPEPSPSAPVEQVVRQPAPASVQPAREDQQAAAARREAAKQAFLEQQADKHRRAAERERELAQLKAAFLTAQAQLAAAAKEVAPNEVVPTKAAAEVVAPPAAPPPPSVPPKPVRNPKIQRRADGGEVDFTGYDFILPGGDFAGFMEVAQIAGIRVFFLPITGRRLDPDQSPFSVVGHAAGEPLLEATDYQAVNRLFNTGYHRKFVRVSDIFPDTDWSFLNTNLRRDLGLGQAYELIAFFSITFIRRLDLAARNHYEQHRLDAGLSFEQGAGEIVFTVDPDGRIRILTMENVHD